jgi:hypothetical protein
MVRVRETVLPVTLLEPVNDPTVRFPPVIASVPLVIVSKPVAVVAAARLAPAALLIFKLL